MEDEYIGAWRKDRVTGADDFSLFTLRITEEDGTTVKLCGKDSGGEFTGWGRRDPAGFHFQKRYGHLESYDFGGTMDEEGAYSGRWSQGQTSGDFAMVERSKLEENPESNIVKKIKDMFFSSEIVLLKKNNK